VDAVEFGRYQLLGSIGEGGMGQVFRARDREFARDVAIKVLPTQLTDQPGYRERFHREAQIMAQLTEPHIVPIFESGEVGGRLYLVMPIIDGVSLAAALERHGPMIPLRAVRIIEQMACALDAAHAQGLVHRDVKPSNALITTGAGREFVYLIDFGIARDSTAVKLTRTGSVRGALAYMAPEQFTTGTTGPRGDIYSLACVLYECLTGTQAFTGESLEQQIAGHVTENPPRPSEHRAGIPAGLDDVIARGMAKKPDDRYQSARALAVAAERALAERAHEPALAPGPPQPHSYVDGSEVPTQLTSTGIPAVSHAARKPARKRRTLAIAIGGAAAAIIAILAVVGYLAFGPSELIQRTPFHQAGPKPGTPKPTAPAPPSQIVLPFTLGDPDGVAVDAAGTVYVADSANNRVVKLPAGSNYPIVLPFTGLNRPAGLWVDSKRGLFVVDQYNNRVLNLPNGSDTPIELPFTGLREPHDVAMDSTGSIYVADFRNNRVLKLPADSNSPTELPLPDLNGPYGVTVDDVDAVYVTDSGNNRVVKLAAGASTPVNLPFTDLNFPNGVAVDHGGSVYLTDLNNNRVLRLAPGADAAATLPFVDLFFPYGVAVDKQGNVYVADFHNRVLKLPPS
jgi:serine/threonine protein kinase, bacterial